MDKQHEEITKRDDKQLQEARDQISHIALEAITFYS